MPVTLDLADEVVARLRVEAERRGVTLDVLVTELAERLNQDGEVRPVSQGGKPSFVAMGSSTSGRRAADADVMLAEGFGRS